MDVKFLYHYCNDPSPNSHNQLWEIKYWSWSWKSLVLTLCPVIIAMSFSLVKTPSAVSLGGANMVRCVLRQDWQEESRHYHWQWSHNFTWVDALVQHLSESMVISKKKNTQKVTYRHVSLAPSHSITFVECNVCMTWDDDLRMTKTPIPSVASNREQLEAFQRFFEA